MIKKTHSEYLRKLFSLFTIIIFSHEVASTEISEAEFHRIAKDQIEFNPSVKEAVCLIKQKFILCGMQTLIATGTGVLIAHPHDSTLRGVLTAAHVVESFTPEIDKLIEIYANFAVDNIDRKIIKVIILNEAVDLALLILENYPAIEPAERLNSPLSQNTNYPTYSFGHGQLFTKDGMPDIPDLSNMAKIVVCNQPAICYAKSNNYVLGNINDIFDKLIDNMKTNTYSRECFYIWLCESLAPLEKMEKLEVSRALLKGLPYKTLVAGLLSEKSESIVLPHNYCRPGDSGGPIFNENDEIIGICKCVSLLNIEKVLFSSNNYSPFISTILSYIFPFTATKYDLLSIYSLPFSHKSLATTSLIFGALIGLKYYLGLSLKYSGISGLLCYTGFSWVISKLFGMTVYNLDNYMSMAVPVQPWNAVINQKLKEQKLANILPLTLEHVRHPILALWGIK